MRRTVFTATPCLAAAQRTPGRSFLRSATWIVAPRSASIFGRRGGVEAFYPSSSDTTNIKTVVISCAEGWLGDLGQEVQQGAARIDLAHNRRSEQPT
jgi:hypothetical protein